MISGQWFQKDLKLHKITHNSRKNMGSSLILTNLVGGPHKEHLYNIKVPSGTVVVTLRLKNVVNHDI